MSEIKGQEIRRGVEAAKVASSDTGNASSAIGSAALIMALVDREERGNAVAS